jgi:hypothetical protein
MYLRSCLVLKARGLMSVLALALGGMVGDYRGGSPTVSQDPVGGALSAAA